MSVTVRVNISAKQALLKGKALSGYADITLNDEQVQQLSEGSRSFLATKDNASEDFDFRIYDTLAEGTFEELKTWLDQHGEEERKKKADDIAKRTARVEAWLNGDESYYGFIPSLDYTEGVDQELMQRANREKDLRVARRNAEADAKRRHEEEERKVAKERQEQEQILKEQAKQAYIDNWVATQSDVLLREQYADGLLCRDTVIDLIAATVLDPIAAFWDWKLCEDRDHSCNWSEIDCLPRRVYRAWKVLRAKLPQNSEWVFVRVHECYRDRYDDEDVAAAAAAGEADPTLGPPEFGVRLTVPEGPFSFERDVKLG